MTEDLKPEACPFCAGDSVSVTNATRILGSAWNRRAPAAAPPPKGTEADLAADYAVIDDRVHASKEAALDAAISPASPKGEALPVVSEEMVHVALAAWLGIDPGAPPSAGHKHMRKALTAALSQLHSDHIVGVNDTIPGHLPVADEVQPEKRCDVTVGIVIAAGMLMHSHNDDCMAEFLLGEVGVTTVEKAKALGVDEYDIEILRPIFDDFAGRSLLSSQEGEDHA